MRKVIKSGEDPSLLRKKQKIETRENVVNTFENIAHEWFKKNADAMAERHAFYVIRRLEANIFPFLGGIPIKEITTKELLAVIRKIEERGSLEVAHRTLQVVGLIFRYAIAPGRAEHDISADLRGALQPRKAANYSYFSGKEFCEFLKGFSDFKGHVVTKLALRLLILTFVRSKELHSARCEEFDFEKREWRIPAERMKMKELHIVPLSDQAIVVLEKIRKFSRDSSLLFPCRTDASKPISDNTLSKAFRDQGYRGKATPHGMRATASTILNENELHGMVDSTLNCINRFYNFVNDMSECYVSARIKICEEKKDVKTDFIDHLIQPYMQDDKINKMMQSYKKKNLVPNDLFEESPEFATDLKLYITAHSKETKKTQISKKGWINILKEIKEKYSKETKYIPDSLLKCDCGEVEHIPDRFSEELQQKNALIEELKKENLQLKKELGNSSRIVDEKIICVLIQNFLEKNPHLNSKISAGYMKNNIFPKYLEEKKYLMRSR